MARSTRRGASRGGRGGAERPGQDGARGEAHRGDPGRAHEEPARHAQGDNHGHGPEHAGHEHEHGHEHGHVHAGYDWLGNPQDLAAYLARLEGADRLAWQKPDEVIRLLGVKRGDRVCDVGVGPGYFALRLARAVGPQGEVYAFDAEPKMLEVLRQRIAEQRLFHVHPILADEGVPPRPCDLVLVVNTFHHFRDGPGYLRRLAGHLKPGGRIANVDFHKRDLPVGPPLGHKVAREDFLAAARQAGLGLVAEHDVLPYQYFLVLEPEAAARAAGPAASAPGARREPEPEPSSGPPAPGAEARQAPPSGTGSRPARAGAAVKGRRLAARAAGPKGRAASRAGAAGKRRSSSKPTAHRGKPRQAAGRGAARRSGRRRSRR